MIRNIVAVILGYALFAISAVLLFRFAGIDPHKNPSIGFIILTIGYGLLFSFLGGLVTQLISGASKLTVTFVLAGIMAGFATFSLFKTTGNHYSQLAAIFLFAPAALLGGFTYLRKLKK
jgi:hypothetical protein